MRDTVTGEPIAMLSGFIPGRLVSQLNARWHWRKRHEYAKGWRDRTRLILGPLARRAGWPATMPKRVRVTAYVGRRFDSHDNLRSAIKPIVDELQLSVWTPHGYRRGVGLITSDADTAGNVFEYRQELAKPGTELGVTVTVGPLDRGGA